MKEGKDEPEIVIRDPIHGYIQLSRDEARLMNTRPLQRLYRINQLGLAYLIYPSATHTRFSHSLGTAYLARKMAEKLDLDSQAKIIVRLAALLHDVGHCPFSHSSEEVIGSNQHWISKLLKGTELRDIIENKGFSCSDVMKVLAGQERSVITQILHSGIDADRLDYLMRDSYFTGLEYQLDVGRIINSLMHVAENITFNWQRLHELEYFLMARYMLYAQVYLHRTVRIADLVALRVLKVLRELFGFLNLRTSEDFLRTDDAYVIGELSKYCKDRKCPPSTKQLIKALLYRRFPRCVLQHELNELHPSMRMQMLKNADYRKELEQEIAHKLRIEPELIFIDVPEFTPSEEAIFVASPQKVSEISEVSQVFQSINRSFGSFFRVYAPDEHRLEASVVSKKLLER